MWFRRWHGVKFWREWYGWRGSIKFWRGSKKRRGLKFWGESKEKSLLLLIYKTLIHAKLKKNSYSITKTKIISLGVIHLWRPRKSLKFGPPSFPLPTNIWFWSELLPFLDIPNWHSILGVILEFSTKTLTMWSTK